MKNNSVKLLSLYLTIILALMACFTPLPAEGLEVTSTLPVFASPTPRVTSKPSESLSSGGRVQASATRISDPTERETATESGAGETLTSTLAVEGEKPSSTPLGAMVGMTATPRGAGVITVSGTPDTQMSGEASPGCLVGTWQADMNSVKNYIALAMIGEDHFDFSPAQVTGLVLLEFSSDRIQMTAEDYLIDMEINQTSMAGASDFILLVQAEGGSDYTAGSNFIRITNPLLEMKAVMTTTATSFELDREDIASISQDLGFGISVPLVLESPEMDFSCAGNTLMLKITEYSILHFNRKIE